MRKKSLLALSAGVLIAISVASTAAVQAAPREVPPTVAILHSPIVDLARGEASRLRTTSSSNLTYHSGPVMTAAISVRPIFWGPKWSNSTFAADKAAGLSSFYSQYGGSAYAAISTQYTQNGGAKATSSVSLGTSVTDTTSASQATADVLNKVVAAIGFDSLSSDAYYPVYTDISRGTAGFCAWHSAGSVTVGNVTKNIKFAFYFNLDGDTGCDVGDTRTTYSQGTESLVNVSAHELAEAITDPLLNAWFDKAGYENGDKCAWKFSSAPNGAVTLQSSATYGWKIQGEWDNATTSCKW